jgi:superfamily I DNA/RNA helicase
MAKESWYINESELDDFQVNVIRKSLKSSFIVKGCAGSGKTVLALWRAKELAESGNHNYLIIVFTKALKQFIEDGIHTIGVDITKVLYHWEWVARGKPHADYIIVDEVQDFDENELADLRRSADKNLVLFGDSAQQLYSTLPDKGKLMTMEEIQVSTKIPMENLVINHRLTKKIARIAEQISLSGDELVARCSKEGVNKPYLVKLGNFEAQMNYIMEVIKAQNFTDVGILFPTNKHVEEAHAYLIINKFNVERKAYYGAGTMDLDFTTDNPKLMTYHSAKGLQFEAVFIPDCTVAAERARNALYVAVTRSYRDLFILYSTNLSPYIEKIDESLFEIIDETLAPPF